MARVSANSKEGRKQMNAKFIRSVALMLVMLTAFAALACAFTYASNVAAASAEDVPVIISSENGVTEKEEQSATLPDADLLLKLVIIEGAVILAVSATLAIALVKIIRVKREENGDPLQ